MYLNLGATSAVAVILLHTSSAFLLCQRAENGSIVPGASPVHYASNSTDHVFTIECLDMYPNPCVIDSYCGIKAKGRFKTKLSDSAHISFNVTNHFDDGRTGGLSGEDDLCNWENIVQNSTKQCPPREGNATVTWTVLLLGGWLPEARYEVQVKVTDGDETVVDLWTDFEMKFKDGYYLNSNPGVDS
ncbi:hypothetical protein MMC11_007597 [Xylographa trunciseda]|nr:hypothetical protein [Xylographa trunciseda]